MAREMSVRTFCMPDSVIRKHLHDCYRVLELLGAPVVTFLAFQEVQVRALRGMREAGGRDGGREGGKERRFGEERRWWPEGLEEEEEPEVGEFV